MEFKYETKTEAFVVPEGRCPECGKLLDRASICEGTPAPPEAGDLAVCFGCTAFLEYDADLRLRRLRDPAGLPPELLRTLVRARARIVVAKRQN